MQADAKPAASADVFPFPVSKATLDNGMRVLAVPYDSPGTVAYYIVIRTGSHESSGTPYTRWTIVCLRKLSSSRTG